MSDHMKRMDCRCGEIRFLVFNIMEIKLGVNVEQICEMIEPDQARERHLNLFWFHTIIPFHGRPVRYVSPKVLVINANGVAMGIIIDKPEYVKSIPVDVLKPIPPLIEACCQPLVIWGVASMEYEMVLLIDLYKFVAVKKQDL